MAGLKWLFYLLLLNVMVEFIGMYIKYIDKLQTAFLYNLLTILQFPLWILLFLEHIHVKKLKSGRILAAAFFIFALANFLFFQGINNFNNYSLLIGSAILILLSCEYLFQIMQNDDSDNPINMPMFWIVCGVLFYFSGTFLYFAFFDYLHKFYRSTGNDIFININLNLIFVLYGCITIGLLKLKSQHK